MLLDFVIKYWLEFGFGLIIALGGYFFKKYMKMKEEEQNSERAKFYENLKEDMFSRYDAIEKESRDGDQELQKQLDALRKGILSMQKKEFIAECQALLAEDHEITLEEYQQCIEDHDAYNGLKGNHNGDSLFALVVQKAKHITD
jgi:hypothetical protein